MYPLTGTFETGANKLVSEEKDRPSNIKLLINIGQLRSYLPSVGFSTDEDQAWNFTEAMASIGLGAYVKGSPELFDFANGSALYKQKKYPSQGKWPRLLQ